MGKQIICRDGRYLFGCSKTTSPISGLTAVDMIPDSAALFPDGKNEEDYRESSSWPCHRWAWEFLRRNPQFQEKCNAYEASPSPAEKRALKKEFGLVRYKHYREEYGVTPKQRPKFTTGNVVCWPRVNEKIYGRIKKNLPKDLTKGQVLVRFDLTKLHQSKDSSIKGMLRSTEIYLKRAVDIWVKENKMKYENPRTKMNLLVLLRLIDLNREVGNDVSDVEKLLSVDEVYSKEFSGPDSKSDPSKRYKETLLAATRFLDKGYLHLAALEGAPLQ